MFGLDDLIGGVVGGIGGLFSGNAKAKAAQDQANLYNQFLGSSDAAKSAIIDKLKAAGYDIFGPQTTSQTGTNYGTQSTNQFTRGSSDTSRTTAAANQAVEDALRANMTDLVGRAKAGVSQGEILNQIANINKTSDAASRAVANKVAGLGLGGAQAAGAYTPAELSRVGAVQNYLASVPQLALNREAAANEQVNQFLNQRAGTHQNYQSNTSGQTNMSGGSTGTTTGGPNIGNILSLMMPTGPKASLKTGQSGIGSFLQGLAPAAGEAAGSLFDPMRGGI
jgi:hypothetical protein